MLRLTKTRCKINVVISVEILCNICIWIYITWIYIT